VIVNESDLPAERAEAGSREVRFTELVKRQSRFIFRVAWAVLRNAHDTEDVVQEAFLKLYRTGAWQRMDDERAFLARTAWRLAVDRSRANRGSIVATETQSGDADPERAAIAADSSAVVQRLIDALPEELRQPLALSAIEELRSGEIAVLMGISEGTVRSRIMRARQILRQKLAAMKEGAR
jgi:RNA polymerase sigma-70 factor (ECF subfamily)